MEKGFEYQDGTLCCEAAPLADIAAKAGTPSYVYSAAAIGGRYQAYDEAFGDLPHQICYSVKANSNRGLLAQLAKAGSWFDIVSGGELYRVLSAGGKAETVVFSGVGKTADEIEYALAEGIHSFNCESEAELSLIDSLAARRGVTAKVALRANPDVDAETHPYISTGLREHKFGIDIAEVEGIYERARGLSHLVLEGVSCHIGSQILNTDPILDAVEIVLDLAAKLRDRGFPIHHIDFGGGLGIPYKPAERAPDVRSFIGLVREKVAGQDLTVMVEPGRSIVGEAGVLLTRVLYRKRTGNKEFIVVDASMSDLIRPSLYGSHHEIVPVRKGGLPGTVTADIVGPVCESGDFLARDREIANVLPGDLLAVCSAGAYGFVLASNYNSRPRPAEVLVEGAGWRTVRQRETYADLVRGE
ncbi:MAG: diaminopimelate decarboxylase [bacterium]|nr:diaminopimelate decarboxylase [bacterium]